MQVEGCLLQSLQGHLHAAGRHRLTKAIPRAQGAQQNLAEPGSQSSLGPRVTQGMQQHCGEDGCSVGHTLLHAAGHVLAGDLHQPGVQVDQVVGQPVNGEGDVARQKQVTVLQLPRPAVGWRQRLLENVGQQVEGTPRVLIAGLLLAGHAGVALEDHLDSLRVKGVAFHHLLAVAAVVADAHVGVHGAVLFQVSFHDFLSSRPVHRFDQAVQDHLAAVGGLGQVLEEGVVTAHDVADARLQHQQGEEHEQAVVRIPGELGEVLEEGKVGLGLVSVADGHKPALDLVNDQENFAPGNGLAQIHHGGEITAGVVKAVIS